MFKTHAIIIAAMTATLTTATVAEAQVSRGFHRSAVGPHGRSISQTYHATAGHGVRTANNSVQTGGGRGITSRSSRTAGNGQVDATRTHTLNNGTSWGRSASATANGNGTADLTRSYTGPAGNTATRNRTVGWR